MAPSSSADHAGRAGIGRRVVAILEQRCPVCLEGRMFAGRFTMHEACAVCGHHFMREPGFFQGAMYVSYLLALVTFMVLAWSAYGLLAPRWGLPVALGIAVALQMLFVPWMWREARVIWAHLNIRTHP
jgi:uncharacterized protein (DUF983 family)